MGQAGLGEVLGEILDSLGLGPLDEVGCGRMESGALLEQDGVVGRLLKEGVAEPESSFRDPRLLHDQLASLQFDE